MFASRSFSAKSPSSCLDDKYVWGPREGEKLLRTKKIRCFHGLPTAVCAAVGGSSYLVCSKSNVLTENVAKLCPKRCQGRVGIAVSLLTGTQLVAKDLAQPFRRCAPRGGDLVSSRLSMHTFANSSSHHQFSISTHQSHIDCQHCSRIEGVVLQGVLPFFCSLTLSPRRRKIFVTTLTILRTNSVSCRFLNRVVPGVLTRALGGGGGGVEQELAPTRFTRGSNHIPILTNLDDAKITTGREVRHFCG